MEEEKEEKVEKYIKAGEIVKKVRDFAWEITRQGISFSELANKIEKKIIELGANPAFPVNISVNEIAAHDTAKIGDGRILEKGNLVKVDIGAHLDGYIADTAFTKEISTNQSGDLIRACEEALEAALEAIRPGIKVSELGRVIAEQIKSFGFIPVSNLSGHVVERYKLHLGKTIPNFDNRSNRVLELGDACAIEPFATLGVGYVIETKESEIFRLLEKKPVRFPLARRILDWVSEERKELPFARRWLAERFWTRGLEVALVELVRSKAIKNYPILREKGLGLVSQAEHTVLLLEEPIVTTKG
jgi:methionyl aminopeptidase